MVQNNKSRRRYLKSLGTVGLIGVTAGCGGSGDGGSGDGGTGDDGSGDGGSSDGGSDGGGSGDGGSSDTDFPQEDITIVIPYGPGGSYDEYTRLIAPYLEEYLPNDVDVVPENVSGAGGRVGTEQYYNAEPDGYTLGLVNRAGFTLTQVMQDVRYDLTEMTYFCQISAGPQVIAASTQTDIVTFDDYVEAVQNEEVKFTSLGAGTSDIVVPASLGELSGLYDPDKVLNNTVTYDGAGEAFQGMLSGDAQITGRGYYTAYPYLESGDLRYIVTATDEPPEQSPEALTLADLQERDDVENSDLLTLIFERPRLFSGPPGIPDERRQILVDAFQQAANDEDFIAEAEEADRPVDYKGPEEAAQDVEDQIELWENNRSLSEKLLPPQ